MSLDERDYMRPKAEYWGVGRRSVRGWLARNSWAPVWLLMLAMVAGTWAALHFRPGNGLRLLPDKVAASRPDTAPAAHPSADLRPPRVSARQLRQPAATAAAASTPPAQAASPEPVSPLPAVEIRSTTIVYRCKQGNQISFSDSPDCPGGKASTLSIDVPQPSLREVADAPPLSANDRARQAAADAQAVAQAAAPDQAAANEQAQARARQLQQSATRQAECGALEQRIQTLDSMARQPQGGQSMDMIRVDREAARARQAALKC
jgi:hypothetical protein